MLKKLRTCVELANDFAHLEQVQSNQALVAIRQHADHKVLHTPRSTTTHRDVCRIKQLRQASNIGLVRPVGARVPRLEFVELVLLGVEAAEADREQDGGGGSETGHDSVVLDKEGVGGERDERLADSARYGKARSE